MNHLVIILVAALSLLCFSCRQNAAKQDAFDEQIAFIENNPQLYLSKIDTTRYKEIRNAETATEFLLAYLTRNYIDVTCYPPKPLLLESIRIFRKNHLNQQQLEALFLLAGIYRRENDLTNELQTIEQSIGIANREDDKEWLFHLYSYLGDMYLRKYNTMKYVRYQTIANQCIKDIPYEEMSLSTRVQVAKSLLYIDHHEKAYRLLQAIENNISESNIYSPQVYCLQGIALYKMEQWSPCIEKVQKILPLIQTNEQKFVCHSILTYCYYHINDTVNAGKHKGLAMSYDEDAATSLIEIEFYKLCAEFARQNHNGEEETACLHKTVERYETMLDSLGGESLDEAIQAYTRIYEKGIYERDLTIYRYVILGFILMLIIGLVVYINRRKKFAYRLIALQQQIQSLENLKDIKDETKSLILRDFEIAKQIAMLKYTQKEQMAKFFKDLEKLKLTKGNHLLATQWEQFYTHIDISFDNFHSLLVKTHPGLNEKEIQLCCLLVAGFRTEEIAAIWMQSVYSVHKYKTNVRKKINAPEASDIIAVLKGELYREK